MSNTKKKKGLVQFFLRSASELDFGISAPKRPAAGGVKSVFAGYVAFSLLLKFSSVNKDKLNDDGE